MKMQTKRRFKFFSHVLSVDLCFMQPKIQPSKIVFEGRIVSGYEQIRFIVNKAFIKTTPGLFTGRFSVTIGWVPEPQAREQVREKVSTIMVSVNMA